MPIKVRIRDFQAIKDASIVIDGLTVVSGPNNCGKTAIMRAIRGVFTNTPGHSFVRNGAEKCIVEIAFEDGTTVKWEKGEKVKPKYTINGKEIFPGKGVPEEVQALGIVPIEAAGREIWPQVADQFTGTVFLLDQPGSVLAEAIADVERVGHLNRALREADKDKRAATGKLKVRRGDVLQCTKDLQKFDGLDDLVQKMDEIEKLEKEVQRVQNGLQGVILLRDQLRDGKTRVDRLIPVESIAVPSAEMVDEVRDCQKSMDDALLLKRQYQDALRIVERTSAVESVSVPSVETLAELREAQSKLIRAMELNRAIRSAQKTITSLSGVQDVEKQVQAIKTASVEKQAKALKIASDLGREMSKAQDDVGLYDLSLKQLGEKYATSCAAVDAILALMPLCPLCKQPVGKDHAHVALEK